MNTLNPLHYLELSCLKQDAENAKWALQRVNQDIQKKICDSLQATTIDRACEDLTRLFQATSRVVQQHFDALSEEEKREVVKEKAILTDISNFEHLGKNNPETNITLLTSALYVTDIFHDKISPTRFRTNKQLLQTLQEIPNAREVFLFVFSKNGMALEFASEALKQDKAFVLAAISADGMALQFASEALKNNPEVVSAAIYKNGMAFQFASEGLKNTPAFILSMIAKAPEVIAFADPSVKCNREFILHAAAINGSILRFLPPEFKIDIGIVETAVSQCPQAIEFASPLALKNPDFLISIISRYGRALAYGSEELKNNPSVVLRAICQNGEALKYASDTLQQDRQFLLEAIYRNPKVFPEISRELQDDPSFVLEAVAKNGNVLKHLNSIFQGDLNVVMQALSNCPDALRYTTEEMQNNDEVVFFAVCKDGKTIQFANSRFQKDKEFIYSVYSKNKFLFNQAKTSIDTDICLEFIFTMLNSIATVENKILATSIVREIQSYKDLFLQNFLICRILDLSEEELRQALSSSVFSTAQKENIIVLLIAIYTIEEPYKGKLESLLKKHYKTLFKDYLKRKPLINLLQILYYNTTIPNEIKYERLIDLMEQEKEKSLISCIQLLAVLVRYESKFKLLKKEDITLKNLIHILFYDFQYNGLLPCGENPEETQKIVEKACEIFMSHRNPQAIFVYGLNALHMEEIKLSIYRYAKGLIESTFYEDRHKGNSHNTFLTPDQKRIWETALEPQQVTTVSSDFTFDGEAFLKQCLVTNRRGSDIFDRVVLQLQKIKDIEKPTELESLALDILSNEHLQNKLQKLHFALSHPQYNTIPFKEDIPKAIAQLQANAPMSGYIVDTEDPEDLFLCGTEVTGSCQRIDGNILLSKCLMGYVLDGKIRLIAVKNKEGVIIARSIIKILIAPENKPVIFFEWVYGDKRFTKALSDFAKKKASSLNIPLFVEKGDTILSSFGNVAPYEFVDANIDLPSQGLTDGKYFIRAKLMDD